MVGGLGQVDYTAFDMFDYAALGHIHAAYPVGRPEVRFAGSPLCYHFNETKQAKKGPLLVTMGEKGKELTIETLAVEPLHPMREMKGSYAELRDELLSSEARGEYLRIVVTDQRITPETASFLRSSAEAKESVLMELTSEFSEFSGTAGAAEMEEIRERSLTELFSGFYAERSGGAEIDEGDLHFLKCAEELAERADINEKPSDADVLRLLGELIGKEAEV
jgi:exonuclease SbcD